MLALTQRYATDCRAAFVIVMHDMNLALRYCRRTLLLFGDGRWKEGTSEEVLTAQSLSELYGHSLRELSDHGSRYFIAALNQPAMPEDSAKAQARWQEARKLLKTRVIARRDASSKGCYDLRRRDRTTKRGSASLKPQ